MKTFIQKSQKLLKIVGLFLFATSFALVGCNRPAPLPQQSSASVSSGSGTVFETGSAYITYSSNPVCSGDEVTITFNNLKNNNCGDSQIQISSDGGATWTNATSGTPVNGIINYTFAPSVGSYIFRAQWIRTGNPSQCVGSNVNWTTTTTKLQVNNCCTTSFEGEAISCGNSREANYYFSSEDSYDYVKIQGGLTNFTGADAVVTVSGGNLSVSQRTPGGSTNRVITLEGGVAACQKITINIKWNSTNGDGVITGDWSAKDANGNEIAPYVDGLTCQ
jgi:hypothetical protein